MIASSASYWNHKEHASYVNNERKKSKYLGPTCKLHDTSEQGITMKLPHLFQKQDDSQFLS